MHSPDNKTLATLTHARLRARQGDYAGAAVLLRRILEEHPRHGGALKLLASIEGRSFTVPVESDPETLAPPQAGDPAGLADAFRRALRGRSGTDPRIARLERWLGRIRRER